MNGANLGTFFASARYARVFAGPDANMFHGQVCASYLAMLCLRGSILDGHPKNAAEVASITSYRVGLVLGYGIQEAKSAHPPRETGPQ